MRLPALTVLAALLIGAVPATAADQAVPMAAHRALYQLTLEQSRGAEVAGATGTMAYEVLDACEGWATRQRLEMTVTNRDGQDIQMLSDYTTWESKDGLSMRFRMRQTTESAVTSEVAGEATLERQGGPGEVRYSLPEATTKHCRRARCFRWLIPRRSWRRRTRARSSSRCRCSMAPARRARRTVRWRSPAGAGRSRASGRIVGAGQRARARGLF